MVRKRAYVFMDTNSLLRFIYAVATARHLNRQTPKRRVVEAKIIEILVTSHVLKETEKNIVKLVAKANLRKHGWTVPAFEVVDRVSNELESMVASGVIVNVESQSSSGYARAFQAVLARPKRRILLPYTDALTTCVREKAHSEKIEKDIPVVEGILLAYDVAAAIPLESRAGIVTPPFLVVTYDNDLFRSLNLCLRQLSLDDKIVLIRYPDFGRLLTRWVE